MEALFHRSAILVALQDAGFTSDHYARQLMSLSKAKAAPKEFLGGPDKDEIITGEEYDDGKLQLEALKEWSKTVGAAAPTKSEVTHGTDGGEFVVSHTHDVTGELLDAVVDRIKSRSVPGGVQRPDK